jgi:NADH:ubiquinone oxidoreductase subunit E
MTDLAATIRIQTIEGLIAKKQNAPGALLPLLHDIQDTVGYIPADSLVLIAQALNLSRAEVHGVVTFYHHFKAEPSGRQVVQLCRAEACKSMGADALWSHACAQLQVSEKDAQHGITTTDQRFSLLPVYCLGLCSTAPAMALDDRVYGRVQCSDFDRLVAAAGSVA